MRQLSMPKSLPAASIGVHLRVFLGLLLGLRKHDFRAAATWIRTMYPGVSPVARFFKFVRWLVAVADVV